MENIEFLNYFIQLDKDSIRNLLENTSDEKIDLLAHAYFLGIYGIEHDRSFNREQYKGVDGLRDKLKRISTDVLISKIRKAIEMQEVLFR